MVRNTISKLVGMMAWIFKGIMAAVLYTCKAVLILLKLFLLLLAIVGRVFLAFVKAGTPA